MIEGKYPQPTPGQLSEAPIYSLSLNPFWWSIVQGLIEQLFIPSHWQDYDAVEPYIMELLEDSGLIEP